MKTKLIYILTVAVVLGFLGGCTSKLDEVIQQGTTSTDNFYQTDEDALEAIAAVYLGWRDLGYSDFWLKNALSDDMYSGGGSRGDNSILEQLNEYRFSTSNSQIKDYFSGLYSLIYRANLLINSFDADTDIKQQAIAEAKAARGWAYFNLVTLWGPAPLVTGLLSPSEYQQANADVSEIWAQIEADYTDAINSGMLSEKSSSTDQTPGARITKQAVQAFLGKAYLFQGKDDEAATILKSVINSEKYELIDDYENVIRAVEDFGSENIFELNSLNDVENPWAQGNYYVGTMMGWRADHISLYGYYYGLHDLFPGGWGFGSPRKELYDAFVAEEGESGYRLNATLRTYAQVNTIGAPLVPVVLNAGTSLYGNAGYFNWKWRLVGSEVIEGTWGMVISANYRMMRYAEVLLLASEACLESGDDGSALTYINEVRDRAQLPLLSSVTLADIKNEKRLELCLEGVRYQDLVRWGDAATYLGSQGEEVPIFSGYNTDGSYKVTYPYTNSSYGFKTGKNELLPFPEHEMLVNQNLTQNPGW